MRPFSSRLKNDKHLLGIELSTTDIQALAEGSSITIDLNSCEVGFWIKNSEGEREFLQPRDSLVVAIQCDSGGDVNKLLAHNGLKAAFQQQQ